MSYTDRAIEQITASEDRRCRETPEQEFELRAGPLSMRFESGGLRYVSLGRHEVLRRVYVAVRDRNWGTMPSRLTYLKSEIERDSFRIEFDCESQRGEIDFLWRGTITGATDGAAVFTFDGVARSTFHCIRIVFCLLHPAPECAGRPCEIIHTNGETEQGSFPVEYETTGWRGVIERETGSPQPEAAA